MSVFGRLQKSFVGAFFRKLFRVKIVSPENEPPDGNSYVVCMNHSSNWDPILIGACMHRPLRYMAKAELFKIPVLKSVVKLFGAFPVDRKTADVGSVKTAIHILEQGEVVGMYPQGTRVRKKHPAEVPPKSSTAAMVAYRAKTGILPVAIISKGYKVKAFRKTTVVFGAYIPFEELEKTAGAETDNKMDLYKKIMDKVYRDILDNYEKYDRLNKK